MKLNGLSTGNSRGLHLWEQGHDASKEPKTPTVAITGLAAALEENSHSEFLQWASGNLGQANQQMNLPNFKTNQLAVRNYPYYYRYHKEEQVNSWKEQETKLLNGEGLDLLINSAGVLTPGPMEVLPLSAVRREFEVNVFGSLAGIHAFPPGLREAKGRIVQIGSMTGRFPLPFSGPSSASKAAMEAFADVYRTELKPFGIDFIMVKPGALLTGGPVKTIAQLKQVSDNMTVKQKKSIWEYLDQFAIGTYQNAKLAYLYLEIDCKIIEISEQVPAPIIVPVGNDAEELLWGVREKSDGRVGYNEGANIPDLLKINETTNYRT